MEGRKPKQYILPALFDVKPVNEAGNLDLERINKIREVLNLQGFKTKGERHDLVENNPLNIVKKSIYFRKPSAISTRKKNTQRQVPTVCNVKSNDALVSNQAVSSNLFPTREELLAELEVIEKQDRILSEAKLIFTTNQVYEEDEPYQKIVSPPSNLPVIKKVSLAEAEPKKRELFEKPKSRLIPNRKSKIILKCVPSPHQPKKKEDVLRLYNPVRLASSVDASIKEFSLALDQFYFPEAARVETKDYFHSALIGRKPQKRYIAKSYLAFIVAGILTTLIVPGISWISNSFAVREDIMANSLSAYQNLLAAKDAVGDFDWQKAQASFQLAEFDFQQAQEELQKINQVALGVLGNLPGGSQVSSGKHLIVVGEKLAQVGNDLSEAMGFFALDQLFDSLDLANSSPLTEKIILSKDKVGLALNNIRLAQQELEVVEIEALPQDIQGGVADLKVKLPQMYEILNQFSNYSDMFLKLLGHYSQKQYLLLFQNNSEMRATGGFIGTYGLLSLDRGGIKELFIDGIFNADGQLHDKIIPPKPIQKISTAWSMHDANWFADFPTSAQKIALLYEKTGGPTVDGVLTFTPTVIERLLNLTGPIDMSEHGITLTGDNFVELIQYKVEVDYDKLTNRPKQILSDFTPKFVKALSDLSSEKKKQALSILFDAFTQKHILVYFTDNELQKISISEGWSGSLLRTEKDYLSVVSSNINGFKTDRVVKEDISYEAEITEDGSVIGELIISRDHQGGNTNYEWWDKVNANYLRVYLPLGTELISVEGHTVEEYKAPIDYTASNFETDSLIHSIESNMKIDRRTGTRISEENGKTVFGNWTYVSPGEKTVIKYRYKLPFKVDTNKGPDSYSLLAQKQSGSIGSGFNCTIKFPSVWQVSLKHPQEAGLSSGIFKLNSDLVTDRVVGLTFSK